MALFPQFPYSNLHELNLDWLIEQISQLMKDGTVISVNGMSGIVTLYTDKDVVFPDLAFDPDWSVYRKIADKQAGLKFTGEKFYYITKNTTDEDFTVHEVFTSSNPPPYPVTSVNGQTGNVIISIPVTSVNGRTGDVVLAGDNIPYNIDGSYTIEDIIIPLEKSIGHVIRYNTCSDGVTAGQYVYLIMSGISGRSDGLYKAVNAKSAGTVWTAADLAPVSGGLGALMASNDSAISQLNNKFNFTGVVRASFTSLNRVNTLGMSNDAPSEIQPNINIDFGNTYLKVYTDDGTGWVEHESIPYDIANRIANTRNLYIGFVVFDYSNYIFVPMDSIQLNRNITLANITTILIPNIADIVSMKSDIIKKANGIYIAVDTPSYLDPYIGKAVEVTITQ